MRELSLIKILNGSVDALYYEASYGSKLDIVPPIAHSASSKSTSDSSEKSRLSSAQVGFIKHQILIKLCINRKKILIITI